MIELKINIKEGGSNNFLSLLMDIYVILIGVGLPLVVKNKYFDILATKYYYYCACTIIMLCVLAIYFIIYRSKINQLPAKGFKRGILGNLSSADYSVVLFYIIALISTITSDYVYEAFWGNEGRFTGLFLLTWYVLSYFSVSRFLNFKSKYIDLILVSGLIVCLFGITDYFNLDILKFKASMLAEQKDYFTSTIGNINTYTSYVGIIVAISAVLFTSAMEMKKVVFYYISMVVGLFALIMGISDNAYLSLGALFSFLPFYLFKDKNGIKRYIIIIATFFSVVQSIGWINKLFENQVLQIDSSYKIITEIKIFPLLAITLWVIVLILHLSDFKKNIKSDYGNKFRYLWLVMLVFIIIGIFYALYDCNIKGNSGRYGSLSSYLLFNDDWGSNRGYIWRNAMECYQNLPFWKKLVGYGPETFGILMLQRTAHNSYNLVFDNAHNEYLHLLTTVGFLGLVSYFGFLLSVVIRGIRRNMNNPYIIAILFGIICYSVQAFINLNLPIVAPILWLLLSVVSAKSMNK
jgi:hypothetical protein